MRHASTGLGLVAALCSVLGLACSADGAASEDLGGNGARDSGAGGFTTDGAPGDGGIILDGSSAVDSGSGGGSGDGGLLGDAACASTQASAIKVPVDIVFVVDQSSSMNDDIANVKKNINTLATKLAATGLSYRVVMIAVPSLVKDGNDYSVCVPPPLGGATCGADRPPVFRQIAQLVDSFEPLKLLLKTYDAAPGPWSTSLRADAFKVFVPITDDNSNPCTGSWCGITAADFDTQLLAKPGGHFGTASKRNYTVFPIIGAPTYPAETPACGPNAQNNGPEYIKLAKLTKGKWFPICLTDFGPVFTEMAKEIATQVACELKIPSPPAGASIDYNKINVIYTPSTGGSGETIGKDDSAPCAAGANGWQYSADKTRVLLCGSACKKVQADEGAKVTVAFGCNTSTVPK